MRATSFYCKSKPNYRLLCAHKIHTAPILDRLEIPTSIQTMNATLYPGPEPGFARQYPNAEADAIWDELELLRTIPITREDVLKLGKDPNIVAKFEDDYWGLGDDAYMAQLDVFHQLVRDTHSCLLKSDVSYRLHCLNQLRQLIYPEYYGFNASTLNHPDLWYVHLNHCVDILAQNIMCTANTDLYTLNWMETQGYPFPDFNINHQCRDFGALLEWRKENGVDIDMWVAMEKPANVNQIPAPQEILDLIQHEFVVHESHNLEVE